MPQKTVTCKFPEFPVVAVVDVVHPHAMYTIALLTFVYVQNVGITYACHAEYPFNKFGAMPTVAVGPNQISRTKYSHYYTYKSHCFYSC
jgi:hypothetical protein